MTGLVLRDVDLGGRRTDVVIRDGAVVSVGRADVATDDEVVDGRGRPLVPGLWDHHLHLLALAAALESARLDPAEITDAAELGRALRDAPVRGGWIRAVGYHDSMAGDLDRADLDRLVPGRPVRVQHRSGQRWTISSAGIDRLGLTGDTDPGVEVDARGEPTGRVYGADHLLRDASAPPPDLAAVGRALASYGVVGVTDATPYDDADGFREIGRARSEGRLAQRVVVTGGPSLAGHPPPDPLEPGPVKLLYPDHRLPPFDRVLRDLDAARAAGRPVAAHCVTRAGLALVLAALAEHGPVAGDRIEHGGVVPPDLAASIADLGLTVVTQPVFVADRGDDYLREVDDDDRAHLYPCGTLLRRGIPVGGSTDAPFGDPNPWRGVAAARDRRTRSGAPVGLDERVDVGVALSLFLAPPAAPGGGPRRIEPGSPGDVVLLDRPAAALAEWTDAEEAPVALTVVAGAVVHAGDR